MIVTVLFEDAESTLIPHFHSGVTMATNVAFDRSFSAYSAAQQLSIDRPSNTESSGAAAHNGKRFGNSLLDALLSEDRPDFLHEMRLVKLEQGDILFESGTPISHVYFPVDCLVTLSVLLQCGSCGESSMVGNDGIVGHSIVTGDLTATSHAIVQTPGTAYRVSASLAARFLAMNRPALQLLLLYSQDLITQTSINAACSRHHTVAQRFARWLLMSLDRLPSNTIPVTQEVLAATIAVRREGVSGAAKLLQKRQIIEYSRGKITVYDRHALERTACECYRVVKKESVRLAARRRASPLQYASTCR